MGAISVSDDDSLEFIVFVAIVLHKVASHTLRWARGIPLHTATRDRPRQRLG
jgi:hypothetical protein